MTLLFVCCLFLLFLFCPKCLILEKTCLETCFEVGYASVTAIVFISIPSPAVFQMPQNFHAFPSSLSAWRCEHGHSGLPVDLLKSLQEQRKHRYTSLWKDTQMGKMKLFFILFTEKVKWHEIKKICSPSYRIHKLKLKWISVSMRCRNHFPRFP